MSKTALARGLFFSLLLAIFILSIWPHEAESGFGGVHFAKEGLQMVSNLAYVGEEKIANSDKYRHIAAFFALAFLLDLSYFFPAYKKFLILLLYGAAIELIQWFLPYRDFDFEDIAFNMAAVGLFYLITRFIFKRYYDKFYEKYKGAASG